MQMLCAPESLQRLFSREGFSSGAHLSDCQVFIMWSVQTLQSLCLLENRHPCLVLESVYPSETLVIVTWGLNHSQRIISNVVFLLLFLLPVTFVLLRTCFHLFMGFASYLHGHCSFHLIAKTMASKRKPRSQHRGKLKHTPICVPSRLWGRFPTAGCWIHLSFLIWGRKHHSEIILPLQFVLGRLLVSAVDSKPCADQ